jgi:hypothetical protein
MAGLLLVCMVSLGKSVTTATLGLPKLQTGPLDKVLRSMRPSLPPSGVIGYIDNGTGDPTTLSNYYLTQYDLAPLIVTRSTDAEWVIGNFSSPGLASAKPRDLVPVHDFGNGVVLYTKKSSVLAKRAH